MGKQYFKKVAFRKTKTKILGCLIMALLFSCSSSKVSNSFIQPSLGSRTVEILKVNGLQFKDLNKNHKLDKYEDWRLPTDERIQDLIAQMTIEEKVGFMLISTTRMAGDNVFGTPDLRGTKAEITSGFNEEDVVSNVNMFTRKPIPYPQMSTSGTTKGVMERQ